jgi:hypothetical protein
MRQSIQALLTKIQANFLAIDSDHIDAAIISAQRELCEFFGTERSSLWQGTDQHPKTLLMTHSCTLDEIPPVPEGITANDFFPWVTSQLLQNKTVIVPDVENLPSEAAIDKQNLQYYMDKSTLITSLLLQE